MKRDAFEFTLSRMASPIGEMLLVTDERGRLRALDWYDHEERMQQLMHRQYGRGRVRLVGGATPAHIRKALDAYFAGQLDAIDSLEVEAAGTPFQKRAWAALRLIPAGQDGELLRAGRKDRPSDRGARRRPGEWRQPDRAGRALPPRDRRERHADRLWRRAGAEALVAGA